MEPVLYGIEDIMGKAENAGDRLFLLFPQCFHMVVKIEKYML